MSMGFTTHTQAWDLTSVVVKWQSFKNKSSEKDAMIVRTHDLEKVRQFPFRTLTLYNIEYKSPWNESNSGAAGFVLIHLVIITVFDGLLSVYGIMTLDLVFTFLSRGSKPPTCFFLWTHGLSWIIAVLTYSPYGTTFWCCNKKVGFVPETYNKTCLVLTIF